MARFGRKQATTLTALIGVMQVPVRRIRRRLP